MHGQDSKIQQNACPMSERFSCGQEFLDSINCPDEDAFTQHVLTHEYGDIELTGAVYPAYDLPMVPTEGYREDKYLLDDSAAPESEIPTVVAALTREKIMPIFRQTIQEIDEPIDIILSSRHADTGVNFVQWQRGFVDTETVLRELECVEEQVLKDGTLSISVLIPNIPYGLELDGHKLVHAAFDARGSLVSVLERFEIPHDPSMKFIFDKNHFHYAETGSFQGCTNLQHRLDAEKVYEE